MREFRLLIDGVLVDGDLSMNVTNPATEEVLTSCPRASRAQLNEAVDAARAAFPMWAAAPMAERKRVLIAIADIVEANVEEMGRLLTQEQGKPLRDAMGEVRSVAERSRYWARQDLEIEVLEDSDAMRVEAHRKPLGVVAASSFRR
jgi:acyl-CoA reductase-like NAD-dependent aldehyde dehydrogenase